MTEFELFLRTHLYINSSQEGENLQQLFVPLASQEKENIITPESLTRWTQDLSRYLELYPSFINEFQAYVGDLTEANLKVYYRENLRFLSKSMTKKSLDVIATHIRNSYDPNDTAILQISGLSAQMIADYLRSPLSLYPVVHHERDGLHYGRPRDFDQPLASKYQNILMIDDWMLTGTQIGDRVFSRDVTSENLHTFHVVMSNIGLARCKSANVDAHWVLFIESDHETPLIAPRKAIWDSFPLYGFHKIPDNMTSVFAGSAKDGQQAKFSIFPLVKGDSIGRHSRLTIKI